MISAVNNNTSHNEAVSKQWEMGRQIYMKELIDTKQNSLVQVNKLEMTIENLKFENGKLTKSNENYEEMCKTKDSDISQLKEENNLTIKDLELKNQMLTYELEKLTSEQKSISGHIPKSEVDQIKADYKSEVQTLSKHHESTILELNEMHKSERQSLVKRLNSLQSQLERNMKEMSIDESTIENLNMYDSNCDLSFPETQAATIYNRHVMRRMEVSVSLFCNFSYI